MNISYNWLKEYVDFDLTAQEVADALTSEGLEVGSRSTAGQGWFARTGYW